jgi:hypothetical protein
MDRGGFLYEYFPQMTQMNADYEITFSAKISGISGKKYLARITLTLNPRQPKAYGSQPSTRLPNVIINTIFI